MHRLALALIVLAAGACSVSSTDLFNCPDAFEGQFDEALQPVALASSDGALWFRFVDQQSRAGLAYQINVHAVPAECLGAAEPLSDPISGGDPGKCAIVVPCAALADLDLYVASWSISVLDASGAALWHSQPVPITVQAMQQIRADCGQ